MDSKPTYEELEQMVKKLEKEVTELRAHKDTASEMASIYTSVFDSVPTSIVVMDKSGQIVDINPYHIDNIDTGTKEDYLNSNILEHPSVVTSGLQDDYRRVLKGESIEKKGIVFPVTTGGTGTFNIRGVPLLRDGKVIGAVMIHEDITGLKCSEKAVLKNESKYRDLYNNAPDMYVTVDAKTATIMECNQTLLDELEYEENEIIGRPIFDMYTHDSAEYAKTNVFPKFVKTGSIKDIELQLQRKDGKIIPISMRIWLRRDAQSNPIGFWGIVQDISERKQVEKSLRESEEKFRTLVEKSPLGIALIADDGEYKYINPQFTNIFGYTIEDIPTGNAWFKKSYPDKEYRQKVIRKWIEDKKQINVGQARPRVFTVTCKNRTQKKIHFRPVTMENHDQFVIYEDISEKSILEQQLLQARKFEAIGTLAGGIAHDFNNLLMGIQGRASLMSLDLEPSHPNLEHIKSIEECIQSATGLTKQLLGFARGGKYEVKPININELVLNSATMFSRTRKEINIHTKMPQSQLLVEADRGQIEQVLLNLYVNAWQAMPDGGELYLKISAVVLDDKYCKPFEVKPGRYAKVSVTDTGIGMNEDTRRRIFDPFFTTKEKSRGAGLGLASAYGIIKNHGGIITVNSERNHGTTFNIYLQISEKEIHQEIATDGAMVKGSETILLVDDEDIIIDVGQEMLKILGYRVVASKSGSEAIEKIKDLGNEIDLVILDLIMPGMDGGKTFDRIREIHPQMPVLLSSGYAVNGQAAEILRRGCNGFIQKPFNIVDFSQKIRTVLNEAKGSSQQ